MIIILLLLIKINNCRKYKRYSRAYKARLGIGRAEYNRIQQQKRADKIRKNQKLLKEKKRQNKIHSGNTNKNKHQ